MKYIDADLLRKEIDHRIDILEDVSIKCAKNDDTEMHAYYHGKAVSLQELLSFIDSLQQEQHFDDLEEAAEKSSAQYYVDAGYSPFPNVETAAHKSGFIAGAEWQKEQMLKEAVEGFVATHLTSEGTKVTVNSGYLPKEMCIKPGDKVRIIIVKEE